jgi:hypothetical protein
MASPFAGERQDVPQAPQFATPPGTALPRERSEHDADGPVLQQACPSAQAGDEPHTQAPAAQPLTLGLATSIAQVLPQPPQFRGSAATGVEHASGWAASQRSNPESQVTSFEQVPAEQIAVAWAPASHLWPQLPQLLGSRPESMQRPSQQVEPGEQAAPSPHRQVPASQRSAALVSQLRQAGPQCPTSTEGLSLARHALGDPSTQTEIPWVHASPVELIAKQVTISPLVQPSARSSKEWGSARRQGPVPESLTMSSSVAGPAAAEGTPVNLPSESSHSHDRTGAIFVIS